MKTRRVVMATVTVVGLFAPPTLLATEAAAAPAPLQSVSQIGAGATHSCALLSNGTVRCWGDRRVQQAGSSADSCGPSKPCSKTPTVIHTADTVLTSVAQLSIGDTHSCAIRSDATAWCWGEGVSGQLGEGAASNRVYAVQVRNPAGTGFLTGVARIFAGNSQTCAVLTDHTARCWGQSVGGGDGALLPVVVKNADGTAMANVVEVEIGSSFGPTCALLLDGTARCWGVNDYGQLGIGTKANSTMPVTVRNPADTGALTGIADLSVSYTSHLVCARLTGGTVDCWGANAAGQLGIGTAIGAATGPDACHSQACSTLPVAVKTPDGLGTLSGVTEIQSGLDFTCARLTSGGVDCWGANGNGVLGDGSTTPRSLPVAVHDVPGSGTLQNVTGIGVGADHACARLQSGTADCWGSDVYSQLGDGGTADSHIPVVVQDGGVPVLAPPNAPTNVTATAGLRQATVSWTAPASNGTPIVSYLVTASPGGQSTLVNAPGTSGQVTGLTSGVSYTFTVRAVSDNGDSADTKSNAVTAKGPPGALATAPTAVSGNGSAVVSWKAPAANGAPITAYVVTPYRGGVAVAAKTFNNAKTAQTLTGLTLAKSYTFRVSAKNQYGTGPMSKASGAIVVGAPGAPTAVKAAKAAAGSLKIKLTKPAANGAPIKSYTATCTSTNGGKAKAKTATAVPVTVSGLTAGKTYKCTVRATNSRGTGPASAPSAAVKA